VSLPARRFARLRTIAALAMAALVVAALWTFVKPAPPKRVVLGTGVADGAYAKFGKRYAELLARDGIEVELRASAGSVQNLARLSDPAGDVDVAIVQSGVATPEQRAGLRSLGSLYFEPLWVAYFGDATLEVLTQLEGRRMGIGVPGSGAQALALKLLEMNGIGAGKATFVAADTRSTIAALRRRELDAAFFVLSPDTALFRELLAVDGLRLMDMKRALSYQRRLPELSRVTLPPGVLDLPRNIPSTQIETVAATARLVARESLHPAIAYLLVRAARRVHAGPDLVTDAQAFPTIADYEEFEVPEDVRRLYKEGPPLLYRYLPFWLANLVYRMWLAGIAAFAIFLTVTDWIPKLFKYHMNARVGRNLLAVRRLESEFRVAGDGDPARFRSRLERLRRSTDAIGLPEFLALSKSDLHKRLDEVEKALAERLQAPATDAGGVATAAPGPGAVPG
jgi:TRAP transporter TAXI family solute receptor